MTDFSAQIPTLAKVNNRFILSKQWHRKIRYKFYESLPCGPNIYKFMVPDLCMCFIYMVHIYTYIYIYQI